MKAVIVTLAIILTFSLITYGASLDDFAISATIYPQKLPDDFENGWFANDQEWLSLSVDFTVKVYKGLYTRFDTKTYIFGTNGFNFAPSSTKFISEFSYKFQHIKVRYLHYCHHYFHQFRDLSEQQDRLIFEYSF